MRGKTEEKHHAAHMAHGGGHRGHHHRKRGGGVGTGEEDIKTGSGETRNAGGNPYVEGEAEHKHGGKVKHKKRKRGGRIHGKAAHSHLGHKGRKRGGKAGADLAPLSSASRSAGIGHQAPVQSEKMSPD